MKNVKSSWSSHFIDLKIQLKMTIEAPTYQQLLMVLILSQSQTVILTTFQPDQPKSHLLSKNIQFSRFAKLLFSQFFLIQIHNSVNILLFLQNFEDPVYSELKTIVVTATENISS